MTEHELSQLPKSRTEALMEGKPFYFTGEPCKNGHIAERRAGNYECMACLPERQKTPQRKAYLKNRASTPHGKKLNWISRIKTRYGITALQFNVMRLTQKLACGICKETFKVGQKICVDHDHSTGKVRALLCDPCNQMIERAREKPEVLRAGANYIEKHSTKEQ